MKSTTTIAIVGAGPYGLSLAAYLNHKRIPFRIFGPPMQVWQTQMPKGMHLKSDGFASDLYEPTRSFTLKRYCQDHGLAYADQGLPVGLDTFVAYALEFQSKFVPMLEPRSVVEVRSNGSGYTLQLDQGETLTARAVVMATGISDIGYVPESLISLAPELCTHSGAPRNLADFRGKRVAVVGGGASATDLAALLHAEGALVSLVSRHPLKFHLPPSDKPRSLYKRITEPNLGLGPGLRSALYTAAPGLFRYLPRRLRLRIVGRHLGPSGGWFMKDQVIGKVQLHVGYAVQAATQSNGSITLRLVHENGSCLNVEADHVIAATGYVVDVERLTILEQRLRSGLRTDETSPALSGVFESSQPGLYFIGVASANSFGPVMRFAVGADYAARRLGDHFARVYGQLTEPTAQRAIA